MAPIQLTEEHKSKLLEMCEKLFPELEDFEIRDSMEDFCFQFEHICIEFGRKKELVIIHWFEFCSRYLMAKIDHLYFEKIMDPLDPYSLQNKNKKLKYPKNWKQLWEQRPFLMFTNNVNGMCFKKHPVDYLYEEFKFLSTL